MTSRQIASVSVANTESATSLRLLGKNVKCQTKFSDYSDMTRSRHPSDQNTKNSAGGSGMSRVEFEKSGENPRKLYIIWKMLLLH